jgi:tRNA(fMet)-specific endonuclease VapC
VIYLLDTNILVYARNGVAEVVVRLDEAWGRADMVTSILVVGELLFGVERSVKQGPNLAAVNQQLSMLDAVLPVTDAVVRRFAAMKADLTKRGRTKGDVDLYIAATAIEVGATVITNDNDLLDGSISGLVAENWVVR